MFSSKAQASAPFELFVALIIMSFVVVIGIQMLTNIQSQVCMASVEDEMGEFKQMIEDTANNKSSNSFSFFPERCFNENEALIKIVTFDSAKECSAKCNAPVDTCFTMVFYTSDIPNGYEEKCLDLPQYTSFVSSSDYCKTVDELAGYDAIDPRDGIPLGQYVTRNVAQVSDNYPRLCVFHRVV